jgi:hypothetical protein
MRLQTVKSVLAVFIEHPAALGVGAVLAPCRSLAAVW